ncbi:hypothetical protein NL676_005098 [Syzygium grande]|nr:hypothetical protein NL676_005098 [Syzygium grande]
MTRRVTVTSAPGNRILPRKERSSRLLPRHTSRSSPTPFLSLSLRGEQAATMEVQVARRMSRGGEAIAGRRRKPLSDRTNALHESPPPPPPSSSSSLAEPRRELASSGSPRRPRAGRGGGGARNPGSGSAAPALALSRPKSGSSSAVGYGDIEVGKPCNVYRRRQTEAKRKCGVKEALQLPPSRSSVERIESIGKKFDKIRDGDGNSKSDVTHSDRKQHPRLHQRDKPNNSLQDFIEQQQSYFAEIDAFELSEEEVAAAESSE